MMTNQHQEQSFSYFRTSLGDLKNKKKHMLRGLWSNLCFPKGKQILKKISENCAVFFVLFYLVPVILSHCT